MHHPFILLLLSASLIIPFRPREERVVVPSPDKKLSAYLIYFGDRNSPSSESKIEIRSRHRRPLCVVRFRSRDRNHGMRILGGMWTPDGVFFIFNGTFTGGRQPGHCPTFFYDRRDNKIRKLDPYTGRWIVGSAIEVSPPDSVRVMTGDPAGDGSGTSAWSGSLSQLVKISATP